MCGILCYIKYDNQLNSDQILMLNKLNPRGPDSSKYIEFNYNDKNIMMGFTRLAIIDLSIKCNQPFTNSNGDFLICNGEIYNYQKLINKFDINTSTRNDCEILLPLLDKISFQSMIKNFLDAEYATIYYNNANKTIEAARDQYGVRPLFYGINYTEKMIGFASEVKGLYPYFRDIHQLKSNNIMTINLNESFDECITRNKYYSFEQLIKPNIINCNTIIVQTIIRYKLINAVKKRLNSDRPIGFLLSGGLDSSLIVSIASHLIGAKNIVCFTIGSDGCDDIKASIDTVKYLGIENHHIIPFSIEEGFNELPNVINVTETYDITTIRASTPQYLMAKYIKEKTDIRVILSGEGSDEVHGSYRYFKDANNKAEFNMDRIRLLEDLQYFDNLRTDRCMAGNGLEVRVPFLDKNYVKYIFSLDTELFMHDKTVIEKKILRDSFKGFLPDDVLYRKKEAFSDSVSSEKVSWVGHIKKMVETKISDDELCGSTIDIKTKEAIYYHKIFNNYYYGVNSIIPYYWMPKFQKTKVDDPSACVLSCY